MNTNLPANANMMLQQMWNRICCLERNVNLIVTSSGIAWNIVGNTGLKEENFLGTTDAVDFILKTDDEERLRVTAVGLIGIGTNSPTALLDVNGQIRIRGGSPGTNKVLTSDANGVATWQTITIPTLLVTGAENGTSLVSTKVQLGGPLIQPTTISSTVSANRLLFQGVGTGADSWVRVENTGNAIAFQVSNTIGTAISAQSISSHGLVGLTQDSTSQYAGILGQEVAGGYGIWGNAVTGKAFIFLKEPTSTNTVVSLGTFRRVTSFPTGAGNGIGLSLDFELEATGGTSPVANQLISKWTNATFGARSSQLELWGVNNTTLQQQLTLKGTGQVQFNLYTGSSFTGTPAKTLAVDSSGNVIMINNVVPGGDGTVTTANKGLTLSDPTTVQLGQDLGAVGNPALISEVREIPITTGSGSIKITTPQSASFQSFTAFSHVISAPQSITPGLQLNVSDLSKNFSLIWDNVLNVFKAIVDNGFIINSTGTTWIGSSDTNYGLKVESPSGSTLGLIVNSSGNVGIKTATVSTTPALALDIKGGFGASDRGYPTGLQAGLQAVFYTVHGTGNWGFNIARAANDTGAANLSFYKTRNADATIKTAALAGDNQGRVTFHAIASDNTTVSVGAQLLLVAGTPGATYVPMSWQFITVNLAGGSGERMRISTEGNLSIGTGGDGTAKLHLAASSGAASTAPIKLTSGTLLTSPETGAVEMLTDKLYFTLTTGTARKEITLNDSTLASNGIPFGTTNGRIKTSSKFQWFDSFSQFSVNDGVDGAVAIFGNGQMSIGSNSPNTDPNFGITNDTGNLLQIGVGGSASVTPGLPDNAFISYAGTRMFIDVAKLNLVATTGVYVGSQTNNPTAKLHIVAGTATAGTAPVKLTAGTITTTPEDGALEYGSSHLYFTIGSTRYQLDQQVGQDEIEFTAGDGGFPAIGDTTYVSSGLVNHKVLVIRNGLVQRGTNPGDGSTYITKVFASNTLTFSHALIAGDYIQIVII